MAILVTTGQLSRITGKQPRTLQRYVEQGIFPRAEKGKYDLLICNPRLIAHLEEQIKNRGLEKISLADQQARKVKAEADLKEIELEQVRGKIVDLELVGKFIEKIFITLRNKMLALPVRAAPQTIGCNSVAEAKGILQKITDEILDEMSSIDPVSIANKIKGDDSAIPDSTDNKRVVRSEKNTERRVKRRARKMVHKSSRVSPRDHGRNKQP